MEYPLTEGLKRNLNKLGMVFLLPVSYAFEFWINVCELIFCKRKEEQ